MERLESVQALRAVAAWMVVIAHGALWASGYGATGISSRVAEMMGSMGVMMFFAVSGFIMVHIGRDAFGVPGAPAAFLRRRLIRIVPLYWLMTLLAAAIILRKGEVLPPAHLVQSLFFIPHSTGGPLMRPVLGVGWTLNYEMFFYILFAAALFFRRGLALLCTTLVGLIAVGQLLNPVWRFQDATGAIGAWTDLLMLPFLVGIALALLRTARPNLRIPHPLLGVAMGVGGILMLQTLLIPDGAYPAWWRIAVLVLSAGVAGFAILSTEGLRMPRWLVMAGNASYSLYLVHPLLFGMIERIGGRAIAQVTPVGGVIFFVGISTVAGLLTYLMIERPMIAWLSRRTSPRRGPPPRTAPAAA